MYTQNCMICERKGGFADLRAHLKAHKITWQEYTKLYGEKPQSLNIIPNSTKKEQMLDDYQKQLLLRMRGK